MILLGGPVFNAGSEPDDVARAHVATGYRAGYFPFQCLDAGVSAADIRDAFERHGVVIAEVGAWRNLIPPDEKERKAAIDWACERVALADEVGARCCVDFAGTRLPGAAHGPHPDNFLPETEELIVATVREILDAVKPQRTRFCLEMMQNVTPDTVDAYVGLIEGIDRPGFGVHLDPVNILYDPRTCYANGKVIRDCIARLGRWIVSCHAKDLVVKAGLALHVDECRPGTGVLDYRAYVDGLNSLGRDIPLMLEHLPDEEEYRLAGDFVRGVIEET